MAGTPLVVVIGLGVLAALAVLIWPWTSPADVDDPTGRERHRGAGTLGGVPWGRLRDRFGGKEEQVAEELALLDSLAAALEAGLPTRQALVVCLRSGGARRTTAWDELERAAAEGLSLAPAWARVGRRTRSSSLAAVARAWTVAATTGAPLATAVRSSTAAARERRRLRQAVRTATAGAQATVWVLTLLPFAGVGMAFAIGVGPAVLFGSAVSLVSAGLGLCLLAAGHLIVRRLTRRVTRGLE